MRPRPTILSCAAIMLFAAAHADPGPRLSATADPAAVTVPTVGEGRRLIPLPDLEYRLEVDAACDAGSSAASLSISVADTRRTVRGPELNGDDPIVALISVPARQVAPLAIEGLCVSDSAQGVAPVSRLVRNVATAQLSLRCNSAAGETITYVARGLDLLLSCASGDRAQPAAASPGAR